MASETRIENGRPVSTFEKRRKWNKAAPMRGFYNVFLRLALKLEAKIRITGLAHVPKTGGVVVMINHISFWDPVIVMPLLGRPMTPMTKVEGFEKPVLGTLISTYGAIPVHRGAVDKEAIRAATEVLDSGQMLLISPEGTRSRTGQLMKGQDGMAFIINRAKTQPLVLPVVVMNARQIFAVFKTLRRPVIEVRIGEPFYMPKSEGRPDLGAQTDFAMRKLAALLPHELRGVYAEPAAGSGD